MVKGALHRILNLLQIVHTVGHQVKPAVGHLVIQGLVTPDRDGRLSHPLDFQFPRVSAQGLPERQAVFVSKADKHLKAPFLCFNQVHHAPGQCVIEVPAGESRRACGPLLTAVFLAIHHMHHGYQQAGDRRLGHGFSRLENHGNQLMNTVAKPLRGLRDTGHLFIHSLP